MIQVATSPALMIGTPADLLRPAGERLPLFVPTTADLFRLDPLLAGKVDAQSEAGCWIWTGATVRAGNGRVPYGSLRRRPNHWLAHRYVFVLLNGEIPAGHELHHSCSTPLCVNPAHLEALDPDEHDWFHREVAACTASVTGARPWRVVQPHHQQPPVGARADRVRALVELTTSTPRTR